MSSFLEDFSHNFHDLETQSEAGASRVQRAAPAKSPWAPIGQKRRELHPVLLRLQAFKYDNFSMTKVFLTFCSEDAIVCCHTARYWSDVCLHKHLSQKV